MVSDRLLVSVKYTGVVENAYYVDMDNYQNTAGNE